MTLQFSLEEAANLGCEMTDLHRFLSEFRELLSKYAAKIEVVEGKPSIVSIEWSMTDLEKIDDRSYPG
jgi:hypothetical protein